jgi:ABC-type Mn2+/Zn2+ transport system ATPase subunit
VPVPTGPAARRVDRGVTIELRDARVLRGGREALVVDELRITPGVTTLIGPNGSGKSTMLHLIAGLLPAATGTVRFDGAERSSRRVAYVLQTQPATAHLLITAREVVALALAADRGPFRRLRPQDQARIDEAMERVEIADLGRRHLAELSGGQRQRVFVAQGLAQQSRVLLLDEPTAGLDLPSTQAIERVVAAERAAGRTVVVASHDLDEAARSDAVVLLNKTVVVAGHPAEALRSGALRRAYGGRVLDLGEDVIAVDDGVHHEHGHHHHEHELPGRSGTHVDG